MLISYNVNQNNFFLKKEQVQVLEKTEYCCLLVRTDMQQTCVLVLQQKHLLK